MAATRPASDLNGAGAEIEVTHEMMRLTLGNEKDHLAAGTAYRLNLRGRSSR